MKIEDIDITKTIEDAQAALKTEVTLSPAMKTMFALLILVIKLLMNRLGLNSSNSSKSPANDPNRTKKTRTKTTNKPGGQNGHKGTTLEPVSNPDEIKNIEVDKASLPKEDYKEVGYIARQVITFRISRRVIEYRAQILEDSKGKQCTALFPAMVLRPAQYGTELKAHCVYLSQFQLLPYERVKDYFAETIHIPVSAGSLYNFNKEAYDLLKQFEIFVKQKLIESAVLNVDETGINVGGKRAWLHVAANEKWTHFFPHIKRGSAAMNEIGILPKFKGSLCHDHWKPYYLYDCFHSLCNAHHLRELQRAFEQDNQQWANDMKVLLLDMNQAVKTAGEKLSDAELQDYYAQYKDILIRGDLERPCPEPPLIEGKKKKGKIKKSKSRNLLERLSDFEEDTLRFLDDIDVPFTNNLAERNLRMTKVQQKISGCFRSMMGASIFCRIRSYISTCRKHEIPIPEALELLFKGELPDFMR